jgi:hypothetical protein
VASRSSSRPAVLLTDGVNETAPVGIYYETPVSTMLQTENGTRKNSNFNYTTT